jgi:hypothetical protein
MMEEEEETRKDAVDALHAIASGDATAGERARHYFQQARYAGVAVRQVWLDTLVEAATAASGTSGGAAVMMLRGLYLDGLRLDGLFDAFLGGKASSEQWSIVLAPSDGRTPPRIPEHVVQRARESKHRSALALWLVSEADDVDAAVKRAMSGLPQTQSDVMPCLKVAASTHAEMVEKMFRRNLELGRGSVGLDLRVLREAHVTLHESSFSKAGWDQLCSVELWQAEDLWHCLADDARPDRLVEAVVRQAMDPAWHSLKTVRKAWRWMKPEQADVLLARFDGAGEERDEDMEGSLAWLAGLPLASVHARERVMLHRLARPGFWRCLDEQGGPSLADWTCFSNDQLESFADVQPGLVLQLSFAREWCRRGLQLKPAMRSALQQPDYSEGLNRAGLCCLALRDVALFDYVKVKPLAASAPILEGARDTVYQLEGRWTARRHRHLPRSVQQVALTTLLALTPLVGTRHIVYMILERSLVADVPSGGFVLVTQAHFEAVIALLRQ